MFHHSLTKFICLIIISLSLTLSLAQIPPGPGGPVGPVGPGGPGGLPPSPGGPVSPVNTVVENGMLIRSKVSNLFSPLFSHPRFQDFGSRFQNRALHSTVFFPSHETDNTDFDINLAEFYLQILKHHVIPRSLYTREIRASEANGTWQTYASMLNHAPVSFQRRQDGFINVKSSAGWVSQIVEGDMACANGVIHIINGVIMPSGFSSNGKQLLIDGFNVPIGFSATTTPNKLVTDEEVNTAIATFNAGLEVNTNTVTAMSQLRHMNTLARSNANSNSNTRMMNTMVLPPAALPPPAIAPLTPGPGLGAGLPLAATNPIGAVSAVAGPLTTAPLAAVAGGPVAGIGAAEAVLGSLVAFLL